MGGRIIRFIFFGNYFVGLLAIALSLETTIQLRLPFDPIPYYILLFSATVMYYTYAYSGVLQSPSATNLRAAWYRDHRTLVRYTQLLFLVVCVVSCFAILAESWQNILHMPLPYWIVIAALVLSSLLYYGLLPKSVFKLNLRNTGWLKAFVIGFVWAGCVSLAPLIMLQISGRPFTPDFILVAGLFVKNWMFCTINAMMFDFKDYADDSNKQLQTFVVRFGLQRTVSYVLIPLTLIGMLSVFVFTSYRHLGLVPMLILQFPLLLMLLVSYSMYRQKSIFYYLIVIDGLVLIKALSGILAMQFIHT